MPDVQTLPVLIPARDGRLAARLHRAADSFAERQPGVVVSGSWLTVKEQMAEHYAVRLAARGFTVLTFDFSGFGESEGSPRQLEMPERKVEDIVAATRFLAGLSLTDGREVGYLAVCASAMYAAAAANRGAPVAGLASVAGWIHDAATVAPFYGGEAGVRERLARAAAAVAALVAGEAPRTAPAYAEGDDRAGMFFPMDYYANPARGRVGAWDNRMDEATWLNWLTYDGLSAVRNLAVPTLFVHGDDCALPDNVRQAAAALGPLAELDWRAGGQTDFYDQPDQVEAALARAEAFFRRVLA